MKVLYRLAVLGACALALFQPMRIQAQSPDSRVTETSIRTVLPELEKYIEDVQSKTGVPGISVAVVYKDQTLYLKGFGVREVGKPELVTPETVFQLASLSKPVGSTVVAALVSEGIVSWDDKISDLDPSFRLHDPYPTSQLTLRDLYSHRSGLPGDAGNDLESLGYSRDEILYRLRYLVPASSFRSAYAYSNFGMTEGGVAAVKPTGKSWEEVSKEKLYEPLGMTHTSSLNADFLKETNVAKPHIRLNGQWQAKLTRQPDPQSPAGGVSSNAQDMAQWLRLQIAKGKFQDKQLIQENELLATHVPQIFRGYVRDTGNPNFYALGWGTQYDSAGRTIWTHNGAFSTGARTIVTIYPQDELGIVVLTNAFPTGVPEAISATFFDLVYDGKSVKDHLMPWEQLFESLLEAPSRASVETYGTPPSPQLPALANAAYVGTYRNDYLGDIVVSDDNDRLVLDAGPNRMEFPLTHWNRDVFLSYFSPEAPDLATLVTFTMGPEGKATAVFIEALNSNGQGLLTRVPDSP